MWRRTEAHPTASMAAIAMVATAAMLLLANSSSCAAAVVLGGGGNVTYGGGGGGLVMTEEMELEMLIEDLYFSVHVSRVLVDQIKPAGTGTGGTGKPGKQACPTDQHGKANCDPNANGKNKGGCKDTYCKF